MRLFPHSYDNGSSELRLGFQEGIGTVTPRGQFVSLTLREDNSIGWALISGSK